MKTYFLALNNSDFNISGNTWTSNVVDLYSNRFYTNFSTLRSRHGINELGDYTFVGTELRPDATPTLNSASKVTNYGEIVLEQTIGEYGFFNPDDFQDGRYIFDLVQSSPFWIMGPDYESQLVYRFVDTTSRVDIIGYKHAFANLPGAEQPTVQVKVYTADKENAQDSEWLQVAYVNQSTSLLFIRDVKRYCKFEVIISSDSSLENSNFLLLVQTQIDEIAVPVISDHTRSVLARFPSWTKIYGDSLERATPSLALPETNAGKMINALIGDDLDKVDELISRIELDSYIGSATLSETAWMYVSTNVAPGFIKIIGDNTELARVSTMRELLETRATDYVFYYNFSTLELYTLRKFAKLKVDNTLTDQIVIQSLNSFDEFGVRVGLQRLYLESNLNFSKRILDVYRNPPAINAEGLKLTLRRELDIWRAVGATPESTYLGATPEIIEISDLETMSKYFSKDGIPTKEFFDFVEYINVKYPTNYGYIKWGEAYWDYAGKFQEGISSIPTILDSATPQSYSSDYQPGIGDFEDARLKLEKLDREITKSSFGLRVSGIKYENTEPAYEPIDVKYDSYISYYEDYVENNTATITYDVKLLLNLHGDIPNDAVYTARFRDYITNIHDQTSSPEYIVRSIFNPSGFTTGDSIYYNQGGTPYVNTFSVSATESYTFNEIPLYSVDAATVSFISASGPSGATGSYAAIGFLDATPNTYAKNTSKNIIKTAAQINDSPYATKLKINSEIYDAKKRRLVNTPKIRSDRFSNKINNSNDITQQSAVTFTPQDIIKNFIIPYGATPVYVHIENIIEDSYDIDLSASPYQGYGGISKNRDQNKTYLIPSVPNVLFSFINPNFATPEQHENYIDTIGSTVNYYFTNIKFPFSATPNQLRISSGATRTKRTNLVSNPNFEANAAKWELGPGAAITLTQNTTDAYIGTACLQVDKDDVYGGPSTEASTIAVRIPVSVGLTYYFSAYVKVPTGQPSCSFRLRIYETDAENIHVASFPSAETAVTDTDGWVRLSLQYTPTGGVNPAKTVALTVQEYTNDQRTFLVDAVLFEQSSTLLPYFDGTYAVPYTYTGYTLVGQGWNGTPNASRSTAVYMSTNDERYPFNYLTWENFTANYIGDIEYYISDHGVVSGNSTVDYSLLNNESSYMVGRYDFNRSDFGLSDYDSSPNLRINTLEVINEDDNTTVHTLWNRSPISIYTEDDGTSESYVFQNDYIDQARWQYLLDKNQATPEGLLNYLDPNTGKFILKNIPIWAFRSDPRNESINPSIKTGWYYQDGEERYIYAKPKTESIFQEATPYTHKQILLPQVARQGAPIIVSVDPYNDNVASPAVEYMQVAFSEEATPSAFSYYNYEYITSKYDDYLALAYSNIFDITIKDEYTGQTVASGLHTPTNIIDSSILASSGMIKAGREYRISYRVKNTFNVDNQYFYEIDNSYRSLVTLLSTPDTGVWLTEVTYESALFDTDAEIDTVSLNPLYVPNNEGYVFISHNSYDLGSIEASLTPREILSDNVDYMALNIWSYDINGNPKPNIPISISGSDISAMPSTLLTSTDGYARAYISYVGGNAATPTVKQVFVQENYSTPSLYSATANYVLKPDLTDVNKLSAEVTKKIINADGEEKVYIFGNATPNASVYWRRGRNLYLALNTEYSTNSTAPEQIGYSGMTTADANGNFQIGPYRAQNDATPGYWFTVVDSEFSPTPTAEPVTIVGDIVYWYERYDVNQSNSGEPTLPPDNGSETGYAHYLSNPAFKMDADTEEVYYENTFENSWNLPIWYPISRYDQYQMGLFGSTPYIIDTYETLRPDYEEE